MNETCEKDLDAILQIICRIGNFQKCEPDDDFYDAGLTSVLALPLLLDLESEFGVTIPDERFLAARSARSLQQMITELKSE
jgi:acyl carrier protein